MQIKCWIRSDVKISISLIELFDHCHNERWTLARRTLAGIWRNRAALIIITATLHGGVSKSRYGTKTYAAANDSKLSF